MMCQCGEYIPVDDTAIGVKCSREVNRKMMTMFPELHEEKTKRKIYRSSSWMALYE